MIQKWDAISFISELLSSREKNICKMKKSKKEIINFSEEDFDLYFQSKNSIVKSTEQENFNFISFSEFLLFLSKKYQMVPKVLNTPAYVPILQVFILFRLNQYCFKRFT
jgi:hypothetical protein